MKNSYINNYKNAKGINSKVNFLRKFYDKILDKNNVERLTESTRNKIHLSTILKKINTII